MAWIESHQELGAHPKVRKLARMLTISRPAVIGHLHYLWWWALDYAQDGNISRIDIEDLAEAAQWEGEPQQLLDALAAVGFIECDGDSRYIHDWQEYAGRLLQQRRANAEKQRAWRDRHKDNAPEVTSPPRNGYVTVTEPLRNGATVPNHTVPNLTIPNQEDHLPPNTTNESDHDVVTDADASSRDADFFTEDDELSFLDEEREPASTPARTQAQPANITALPVTTAPVATPKPKQPPKARATTFDEDSEPMRLACYLKTKILIADPTARTPKDLTAWASDLDKMLRLDPGRTYDSIKGVIDYATTDTFWQPNILSAGKLRDKYDTLNGQLKRKQQQQRGENYHNGHAGHYAATGTEGQSSGRAGADGGGQGTLSTAQGTRGRVASGIHQPDSSRHGIYAHLVE